MSINIHGPIKMRQDVENKKPKQGGMNDVACFYDCYGLLSILRVLQKDNKQVHNEFYEKIRKELNVTKNYTNQKTKRTVISTTKRMKMKQNDSFECRKCKETCIELNERMNKNQGVTTMLKECK